MPTNRSKTSTTAAFLPTIPYKAPERVNTSAAQATTLPYTSQYDVLVAGALAADLSCDYAPLEGFANSAAPLLHTSNPAILSRSIGGVGHNTALAAHYAGADALLCSAVANDVPGRALIERVQESGLSASGIKILDAAVDIQTAQYVAMNDIKKDLVIAMADMSILSAPVLDSVSIWKPVMTQCRPKWVVIDGNWSTSIISHLSMAAKSAGARTAFEPVSAQKSSRIIKLIKPETVMPNQIIDLATPNVLELQTMYNTARDALLFESESWWSVINALNLSRAGSRDRFVRMTNPLLVDQGVPQQSLQLLPYVPCIVTKLGAQGCLVTQLLPPGDPRLRDPVSAPYILATTLDDNGVVGGVYMRLFPPAEVVKQENVVSVNGAGDTLMGVLVAGLAKKGAQARVEDVITVAQEAAVRSLKSNRAVSEGVKGILN
jgi:pseudouridylate synthase / pseudouridine kinase